jgi:hypothetical protein
VGGHVAVTAAVALDARGRRLRAALGFLRLPPTEPELRLVHRWLDNWSGLGLVVAGMTRQGFQLGLDQRTGSWLAVFYSGSGGHHPVAPAGTGQAPTPWKAVQMAAWAAVDKEHQR